MLRWERLISWGALITYARPKSVFLEEAAPFGHVHVCLCSDERFQNLNGIRPKSLLRQKTYSQGWVKDFYTQAGLAGCFSRDFSYLAQLVLV